jgi:hypothetical protein
VKPPLSGRLLNSPTYLRSIEATPAENIKAIMISLVIFKAMDKYSAVGMAARIVYLNALKIEASLICCSSCSQALSSMIIAAVKKRPSYTVPPGSGTSGGGYSFGL